MAATINSLYAPSSKSYRTEKGPFRRVDQENLQWNSSHSCLQPDSQNYQHTEETAVSFPTPAQFVHELRSVVRAARYRYYYGHKEGWIREFCSEGWLLNSLDLSEIIYTILQVFFINKYSLTIK